MGVDTTTRDRADAAELARLLATCIDEPLAFADGRREHDAGPDLRLATDLNDAVADIIFHELVHLLDEDDELHDAAVAACRRPGPATTDGAPGAAAEAHRAVVERLHRALASRAELTQALASVLGRVAAALYAGLRGAQPRRVEGKGERGQLWPG
jgi:hypothetical protein